MAHIRPHQAAARCKKRKAVSQSTKNNLRKKCYAPAPRLRWKKEAPVWAAFGIDRRF